MVKVLLAGAEGGLGRAFSARLAAQGETVVALGRGELDLTRRQGVEARVAEVRPDVIIDAAAFSDVDVAEVDKWGAYLSNRDGAEHLARASAGVGALVVYPSCYLVFDGERLAPYREEDAPNPLSTYGDSKLAGELAVMKHAPRHLILRTGWLYGAHGRSYFDELLEWQADDQGVAFAHEEPVAQPTLQEDFVAAALELVRRGQTGLWHAASEGQASPAEFGSAVYELLGARSMEIRLLPRGKGRHVAVRPKRAALDCGKLAALGVRMRPWKDALREFVQSRPKK